MDQEADKADAEEPDADTGEAPYNLWKGLSDAVGTIPENLKKVFAGLADPLKFASVSGDKKAVAEELETDVSVFKNMRARFSRGPHQAFAYLLFILLYVPCIAAMGAAFRELGRFYGLVLMGYLTVLGWSVATLYYQFTLGHQTAWIAFACTLLATMFGGFWLIGRRRKIRMI